MKKAFCLTLLFAAMMFTSCEYHEPEIITKNNRLLMVVGEYTKVEVSGAKEVFYSYSDTRDESKSVFEFTDYADQGYALVHALNPGTDTLFVGYKWTAGIYAYGKRKAVIITVLDK